MSKPPTKKMPAKKPSETEAAPNRSPRWRQGPVNVGNLALKLARPALGKRGFAGAEIISHWPTIVGADLAAFACPLEVKYPRGRNAGAKLHLRVSHGAAATMLQMKIPLIIARINRFFGYEAVTEIQAAQGPLPQRARKTPPPPPISPEATAKVERDVAGVASPEVREALTKLGKTLQQRGR
jgi:hypothetical protein